MHAAVRLATTLSSWQALAQILRGWSALHASARQWTITIGLSQRTPQQFRQL